MVRHIRYVCLSVDVFGLVQTCAGLAALRSVHSSTPKYAVAFLYNLSSVHACVVSLRGRPCSSQAVLRRATQRHITYGELENRHITYGNAPASWKNVTLPTETPRTNLDPK